MRKKINLIRHRVNALDKDSRRILSKSEVDTYINTLSDSDLDWIEHNTPPDSLLTGRHIRRVLEL
jgi:hypothetical protein